MDELEQGGAPEGGAEAPSDEPQLSPAIRDQLEADSKAKIDQAVTEAAPAEEAVEDPEAQAAAEEEGAPSDVDAELERLAALEGRHQAAPAPLDPNVIAQRAAAQAAAPMNQLLQQLSAVQRQRALEAAMPQKPDPVTGTPADWAAYTEQALRFQAQQIPQQIQGALAPLLQRFEQQDAMQRQLQQQQRVQAYEQQLNNAIGVLSSKPEFKFLSEGNPQLRQALLRTAYAQARQHGMDLASVARELSKEFAPPSRVQTTAARARAAQTQNLAAARTKAAKAPVAPGGASGKAGAPPKTRMEKMQKAGMWDALPPDMKAYYELRHKKGLSN